MSAVQTLLQTMGPAIVAGAFGCASAFLTARFVAANERRKFEREATAKLGEWERGFAMRYAEVVADSPAKAEALRQQFATAYLHLADRSDRIFIPPSARMIIGRGSTADIRLEDTSLSRAHASIESGDGAFWLRDLHATNGTLLNGEPVGGPARLKDGDEIQFGHVKARFHLIGDV